MKGQTFLLPRSLSLLFLCLRRKELDASSRRRVEDSSCPHCVAALLPKEKKQKGTEGRGPEENATSEGGRESASCLLNTGPGGNGRKELACLFLPQTCSRSTLENNEVLLVKNQVGEGGGFSWGGVDGWGEKAYNCN